MKHYGDITKINGATVPAVDIICGGSPCQDLSIAGKRAGLAGERSGLFMDQIRIIKEMRRNDELHCGRTNDTVRCRFMVWENVAGAFSSNNGEDFRAVLEETVRVIDKDACVPSIGNRKWPHAGCIMGTVDGTAYSVAWRLHDAQFWGVPQRRKRIALVADFGGTAAPEILFECESMSRNTEQGEQTRQGTSDNSERSIGETSKCLNGWDVQSKHVQPEDGIAEALYSGECRHGGGESYVLQNQSAVCVQGNAIDRQPQNGPCGKGVTEDVSFTLNTVDKHAVAYRICSVSIHSMQSDNPKSGIYKADVAPTVDVSGGNPACNQGGLVITNKVATYQKVTGTLSPGAHPGGCNGQDAYNDMLIVDANSVAYGLDRASYNQGKNAKYGFSIDKEKIGAQTAMGPGAVFAAYDARGNGDGKTAGTLTGDHQNRVTDYTTICANSAVVRRLTPKECERLQGFPDDWTNIGDWKDSKGKLHKGESDSPRYKALGNSIALPFWEWLAERIAKHLPQGATMASLFDGIGGFPLVFSRAGVRPVWASEIEEFPIAVTKKHFPEE